MYVIISTFILSFFRILHVFVNNVENSSHELSSHLRHSLVIMKCRWPVIHQLNAMSELSVKYTMQTLWVIYPLWPSDAIWRQWTGSTLVQVMAYCLMAPSHCPNQCWIIIKGVLWHRPESNFSRSAYELNPWHAIASYTSKITTTSPRGQWLNLQVQLFPEEVAHSCPNKHLS